MWTSAPCPWRRIGTADATRPRARPGSPPEWPTPASAKGDAPQADAILRRLRLIVRTVSLGGVETLATRPPATSHASLSAEEREHAGMPDGLVRIAVSIEPPADMIADLINQAFARRLWPDQHPLRRRFRFAGEERRWQVVGAARNANDPTLGEVFLRDGDRGAGRQRWAARFRVRARPEDPGRRTPVTRRTSDLALQPAAARGRRSSSAPATLLLGLSKLPTDLVCGQAAARWKERA